MRAYADPRFKKRLPCQVTCGASHYAGMITNLSRSGLFVQTAAGVGPGEMVEVALQAPTATPDVVLRSRVVWKQLGPPQPGHAIAGGIGVQIQQAPESYYSLLEAIERLSSQVPRELRARRESKETPRDPRDRFRIRLQQIGGTSSRTLEVDAESEHDARRSALALAGPDWSIAEIARLSLH